jgi:hypothetical protein
MGSTGLHVSSKNMLDFISTLIQTHNFPSVFVPNFTGSTGFGQEFVDAVAGDWGGAPFVDMRAGWAHVCSLYPEIDEDRAGAAGGSWGGYAVKCVHLPM